MLNESAGSGNTKGQNIKVIGSVILVPMLPKKGEIFVLCGDIDETIT